MGGAMQTCRIAKMTRYKRSAAWRKVMDNIKSAMLSSPPASPFNSTASLMRQRSQQQKEAGLPPLFTGELESILDRHASNIVNHYGSNSKDTEASCCTFATDNHDQGCNYKSQPHQPVIVRLSPQLALARNMHLELQAKLQVTDSSRPERKAAPDRQLHQSSSHFASSAGTRKQLENLVSDLHEKGLAILEHPRTQSFTADNFDTVQSSLNATSCAKMLDEIVADGDLRNNFCAFGIQEVSPALGL